MKILLVEDEAVTLRIMTSILENGGYRVLAATSVTEALKILKQEKKIDLIITDGMLPGIDGFQFLDMLNNNNRFNRIPTIMCTVLNDKVSVNRAVHLGAKGYITKPINKDVLLCKVSEVIDNYITTILLVDDEATIVSVLSSILSRQGYKVMSARDAAAALEVMNATMVRMVISNVDLPGMSGIELLKKIKADYPGTPVIIITGRTWESRQENVKAIGADGSISKPFRSNEILYQVKALLDDYAKKCV